jgi:actin-related protein
MEEHGDIHNQLKSLTNKTAHIEKMLGRGAKTVIMQFGSHSLKFGLANDPNPQWLRCLVARKTKETDLQSKAYEVEADPKKISEVAKVVEAFLTKKGNIKKGELQPSKPAKAKPAGKTEAVKERCDFTSKPTDFTKDVYIGEEVYFVEGRKDFKVREPMQYGLLNIGPNYTEADAIRDLELVVRRSISLLGLDHTKLDEYSVVLCLPDKFHRGQCKLIIDMMVEQIGFGAFALNLESILATFGSGLQLACVVDIGYTSITVTTVDEGVIVPNSQIKKHYGVKDLDVCLYNILFGRGQISSIPENSELSVKKYKHLAALEKFREKFALLVTEEQNKIAEINLPAELNEPTKVTVPFSPSFVVGAALFFHNEVLSLLDKKEVAKAWPQFDRSTDYFEGYQDEEDYHDDTEAKVNKMMAQCLQQQDFTKKQQILDTSKIDVSRIQQEYNFDNLEDMISYSIFQLKDAEARKKAANSIVITGGFSRTPFLVEELEDRLIERIAKFDPHIERVEVLDFSKREFDNSEMVWIGGSILPKLDCMKDGFVSKGRWTGKLNPEEEREKRMRREKDSPEFGIKYLKEKLTFQW